MSKENIRVAVAELPLKETDTYTYNIDNIRLAINNIMFSHTTEKQQDYYDMAYSQNDENNRYLLSPEKTIYCELWQEVLNHISSNEKIIDCGCGVGQFAQMYNTQNKGHYVRGIDFSPVAIQKAKERNPEIVDRFHLQDIREESPFLDDDYDTILFIEVLEHIKAEKEILCKVPAGKRIILSLPNFMCEAHVRCFVNERKIYERYNELLTIDNITEVKMKKGKSIYICDCRKV